MMNRQTGFSMIEVLVALLVLSIGLLGLAMLQVQGMKFNSDAYFRTQATILAYDIIDRMRANPKGDYQVSDQAAVNTKKTAYDGCKGTTPPGDCNCDAKVCSTANLALYDIGKWYEAQAKFLPAPITPSLIIKAVNQYTITLRWMERDLEITQTWTIEL
jgi:type IV pilus assembly protein PilV